MKQHEAVIHVMQQRGGYSTLGDLYLEAMRIPDVKWKTRTPFASIRRIVQDSRFFFKIRPGLWALNEYKTRIPAAIRAQGTEPKKREYTHSYYQGLLVEIGNLGSYQTFVPNQDKNRKFLDKPLASMVTLPTIYPFSYDHIVKRAQTIDVIWFNERNMPTMFFEVEHSTDIQNSLLKFLDLQDFNVEIRIIADKHRKREYQSKLTYTAFKPVARRVKFTDYETVSDWHSSTVALSLVEGRL